jgi:hypothetical protein
VDWEEFLHSFKIVDTKDKKPMHHHHRKHHHHAADGTTRPRNPVSSLRSRSSSHGTAAGSRILTKGYASFGLGIGSIKGVSISGKAGGEQKKG